jgi:hypothetical protein
MTLFRIASLATVWVLAEVPESQAAALRPGQAVMASTTALPNLALPGKVDTILPDVSAGTRTIKVRIELQNKDRNCCRACPCRYAWCRRAHRAPARTQRGTDPDRYAHHCHGGQRRRWI